MMRFINFLFNLLNVNYKKDAFLDEYYTTIGDTIFVPGTVDLNMLSDWGNLLHEITHVYQRHKFTFPLFAYLYLFPISGGLLTILAGFVLFGFKQITAGAFCIGIGSVQLIPYWPDPFRTRFEYQAYGVSLYCAYLRKVDLNDKVINNFVEIFTDMSYYKMINNKQKIRNKFSNLCNAIYAQKYNRSSHPVLKYLPKTI